MGAIQEDWPFLSIGRSKNLPHHGKLNLIEKSLNKVHTIFFDDHMCFNDDICDHWDMETKK